MNNSKNSSNNNSIVNLTPHEIVVHYTEEGDHVSLHIPPSGDVARVSITSREVGEFDGIPLSRTETGEVKGVPNPQEGVLYLVSAIVRGLLPERKDVASPGPLVRDENGQPIGCQGLVVN